MTNDKKISIIIPAYNAANFLEDAVNSIIYQKLDSFEIIIINDASTDNTREICDKIIKKYSHYDIIYDEHDTNRGGGATRNTCVKKSRGKYIFNLDADNILSKGLLNKLLDLAENYYKETKRPAMVSPSYIQYFSDDNLSLFGFTIPIKRRVTLHRWYYDRLDYEYILTNARSPASSGNYLFCKSIFDDVNGYFEDCGSYDAWSFGLKCYINGYRYILADGTQYLHRIHGQSYWSVNNVNGMTKVYLYRAINKFKDIYSDETLKTLDPSNPRYPSDDIFKYIRLRT